MQIIFLKCIYLKIRRTRHAGHYWRSNDKHISDILLWTPSHGQAKVGQPARTDIQQFCADTRWSLEDLLGAMDDKDGWWERIREIRASSMTWWWWLEAIIIYKGLLSVVVSWNHIITWNTWNHIIACMLVLERNTWNHIIIYKLLLLDRNTWNYIIGS